MKNDSKKIQNISSEIGWYISGFVDGEGSFNVSLKKADDYRLRWKVSPSFNVSQRDSTTLKLMKETLGVGTMRTRKDGVVYYEVRNYTHIHEVIIPFFERFPFKSKTKLNNFKIFKSIITAMTNSEHLTEKGLKRIVQLREELNKGRGRKRKYTIKDI